MLFLFKVIALPHGVLEMILVKSVVKLYSSNQDHRATGADILSLVTVCSVCYEWYAVITRRDYNRRQVRHHLKPKVT